jgi:hypothetical protein
MDDCRAGKPLNARDEPLPEQRYLMALTPAQWAAVKTACRHADKHQSTVFIDDSQATAIREVREYFAKTEPRDEDETLIEYLCDRLNSVTRAFGDRAAIEHAKAHRWRRIARFQRKCRMRMRPVVDAARNWKLGRSAHPRIGAAGMLCLAIDAYEAEVNQRRTDDDREK